MKKPFQLGEWTVDVLQNELVGASETIKLEPRVMQVLACLATRAGKVVSREQLLEDVWGDRFVSDEVLTVAIQKLRSALGDDSKKPRFVQTVPGKGYRLDEVVEHAEKPVFPGKLLWVAAVLVGAAAIWLFVASDSSLPPNDLPYARIAIDPPPESFPDSFVISPDGKRLAFIAPNTEGTDSIWLRELDSGATRKLPGTDNVLKLFWSPDSLQIAYIGASPQLKTVSLSGEPPELLRESWFWGSGTWGDDDVMVLSTGKLFTMPAAGGEPTPLTLEDGVDADADRVFPSFLPGGRQFLYYAVVLGLGIEKGKIFVGSLDSAESVFVVESDSRAVYADGYLLFVDGGTLHAQEFDLDTLELRGERRALEAIMTSPQVTTTHDFSFSASKNGVLAFRGGGVPTGQLVWFDREGQELGRIPQPPTGEFVNPSLSPDGQWIAANRRNPATGDRDIWLIEARTGVSSRLTSTPSRATDAIWSPDGRRIVFGAYREGRYGLWLKTIEDRVEDLVLEVPPGVYRFGVAPTEWSDDGIVLYGATADVWAVSVSGEREPWPVLDSAAAEYGPQLSPSGEWLAYISSETGDYALYVERFPERTHKRRISAEGGGHPTWREDGKELFYRGGQNRIATLMRVDLAEESGELRIGTPEPLFDPRIFGLYDGRSNYAVSPDGQRFLLRRPSLNPPPVTVVVNWTAELK